VLNDLVLLFGYKNFRKAEPDVVKLLMRVMCNTMQNDEARRQFSMESIKPLISLINIIDESKDKELVANGLVCMNLAFSQTSVINRAIREFGELKSRITEITSKYAEEDHI